MWIRREKSLAEIARRNRREIIEARLTRGDLFKLGLLTGAGYLVAKKGLSSRAYDYAVGDGPAGLAFDGTSLWVAPNGEDRLVRMRPGDGAVLDSYDTGQAPFGVAWDGARLWVANFGSDSVSIVPAPRPPPMTWGYSRRRLWALEPPTPCAPPV